MRYYIVHGVYACAHAATGLQGSEVAGGVAAEGMAYRAQEEPLSQVMKSIENLDVTSMRPDIQKVRVKQAAGS